MNVAQIRARLYNSSKSPESDDARFRRERGISQESSRRERVEQFDRAEIEALRDEVKVLRSEVKNLPAQMQDQTSRGIADEVPPVVTHCFENEFKARMPEIVEMVKGNL